MVRLLLLYTVQKYTNIPEIAQDELQQSGSCEFIETFFRRHHFHLYNTSLSALCGGNNAANRTKRADVAYDNTIQKPSHFKYYAL